MTTRSDWETAVLKSGASKLSELEAPLSEGGPTYPLLGPDDEGAEESAESFPWRVRVVLNGTFDSEQLASLKDPNTEVVEAEDLREERLSSGLEGSRSGDEGRVRVDLKMLKNLTEIRKLRSEHPELRTWVLVSEGAAGEDPETLVGETIRQMTGVLAGCNVLEIRQGEGEPYGSVFSRVNVARLMNHESELCGIEDPIRGAGFFRQLAERL